MLVVVSIFFVSPRFASFIDYFFVLWVLMILILKLNGRVSLATGLFFLLFCAPALVFERSAIAQNSAVVAFSLFIVGVLQLAIDEIRDRQ